MMINNNPCLCSPVQKWATQWPLAGRPRSQCHLIYYPAWALSAHKQSHYVRQIIATLLRKTPRATPLGARACLRVQAPAGQALLRREDLGGRWNLS